MSKRALLFAAMAALISPGVSHAAVVMSPLTTFGTNGWLAPGSSAYLGILNDERGMTFGNGHVYLVSHAAVAGSSANIRILDRATGADLGGLNSTGITGGTFAVNNAAIGADGAIYVANLTVQSTTSPFKVYKWTSEAGAPIVAYTGDAGLAGSRFGDDFAGIGSGSERAWPPATIPPPCRREQRLLNDRPHCGHRDCRRLYWHTSERRRLPPWHHLRRRLQSCLWNRREQLVSIHDQLRLNRHASRQPRSSRSGGRNGTALMAYAVVAGEPLLAVQSIGDSHVSLFDVTDPLHPVYITAGNNTTGTLTANGNGTGELAWDVHADGTATLLRHEHQSGNTGVQRRAGTCEPRPAHHRRAAGVAPHATGLMTRSYFIRAELSAGCHAHATAWACLGEHRMPTQ